MSRHPGFFTALVAFLLNVVAAVAASFSHEPGFWYLLVILLLCAVQSFLLPFLFDGSHYRWLQYPSLLVGLMWSAYVCKRDLAWLGAVALVGAGVLVGLVLFLLNHILVNPLNGFTEDAKKGPVIVLLPFLTLFLHLTFFLTFALAFIDKSSFGPILAPSSGQYLSKAGDPPTKSESNSPPSRSENWVLTFPLGSADPGAGLEEVCRLSKEEFWRKYRGIPTKISARSNWKALCDIANFISSTDRGHRVRVLVVGHANDSQPVANPDGRKYRSNFELSAARAVQVQLLVLKELGRVAKVLKDRPPIEWIHMPVANEDVFLDKVLVEAETTGSLDPKLVTEILATTVEDSYESKISLVADLTQREDPTKNFELLDYLYFMVYTITTTGYGDIIPTKPAAKFITIVANLIEVLYLVVFLNVLLTVIKPKDPVGSR